MLQKLAADGVLVRLEQRGYRVPGAGLSAGGETPILELPPDALEIVRGRAGWEKIWDQVERDLVACMPFGRFKINELAMADHYGVSRTVTRDLLGRLEARNLVEKIGRSQRFLRELVPELMNDLYEVRRLLEPTALVNAAPRLSKPRLEEMRADLLRGEEKYPNLSAADIARYEDDLHVECTEACLNRPLIAALRQSQLPVLATNRLFQIYLGMPTLEPFLAEHRLVIELVLDNAPEFGRGRPRRPSSQRRAQAANEAERPQGPPPSGGSALSAPGRQRLAACRTGVSRGRFWRDEAVLRRRIGCERS